MSKKAKPVDEPPEVPAWVVSFSDMITLLLAFFVLLQAFAKEQDPELFFQGQGSFCKALKNYGLPAWMLGRENRPAREYAAVKYTTKEAEKPWPKNDLLDGELERIQEQFRKMRREIDTQSENLSDNPVEIVPTPIRFAPGEAELNEAGRQWVKRYALDLKASPGGKRHIYVIGMAAKAEVGAQPWRLSALRAVAVETLLRRELDADMSSRRWEVQSWGAGGQWSRSHGLVPEQSHIALAVMEVGG